MVDNSSNDTPRSDATLPLPPEIARQGGGERFGRFHLSKRLGAGISHDLWQAWDPEKQQWLALRVWPRPAAGEKELVLAAGKSARAAGDPRILAPAGGGLESGQLWLARPYLEALPVRDLPWQDGRTLARVAKECAEALAVAHGKGLAHGRVTAGNVLVVSKEVKGREWEHAVSLTEFGLSEGDAASDTKALGRIFCELTGQPTPGSGATTRAAKGAGGDSTDLAKRKGDTTRGSASGETVPEFDGALVGIFLRTRDGQLDAAAAAAELGAWLARGPKRNRPRFAPLIPAVAVSMAFFALVAVWITWRQKHRVVEPSRALQESATAEAEGHLDAALERARAAAAADPKDQHAAEIVKRLSAAVAERDAGLETDRKAAAAAKEADRRLVEARPALAAAEDAARAAAPERALIDKLLAPALSALEASLRAKPGYPPALRLLEEAATLFEPGDLSRLPRGIDGRPIITPAIALRADLSAWVMTCYGPLGISVAHKERTPVSNRLGLFPPPARSIPVDPVPFPDPAVPGQVARSIAEAGTAAMSSPAAAAWSAAIRALFALDTEGALKAARSVHPAPDDPFAPDLDWVIRAADTGGGAETFEPALRSRPWDPLFVVSHWFSLRLYGRNKESLDVMDRAIALHPGCVDFRLARGWGRYAAHDFQGALSDAAFATEREPAALILAGEVSYTLQQFEDAVRLCTEAIRRAPSLPHAFTARAECYLRLRRHKEAIEDAEAAVSLDPGRLTALLTRATVRDASGDRAGALADCEKALRIVPDNARTLCIRGWAYLHSGDDAHALEDAEKAMRLDGECWQALVLRAFVKDGRTDADGAIEDADRALLKQNGDPLALTARGIARRQKGDTLGAREDCSHALQVYPGLHEAIRLRALIQSDEQVTGGVIEDATAVLEIDPRDQGMLRVRARARCVKGMLKGALEDCDAALAIDPRDATSLVTRASARGQLLASSPGGEASVLEDIDRALSLEPKNLEALGLKASMLSRSSRHREAADIMTRALEVQPGDVLLLGRRAAYRELAGDVAGALEDANAVIKGAPKSAAGFYRRSSLMMKKGDLEAALFDAVDGTRAEPGNIAIWRQLGDVYRARGTKDRALEAYGQAVERAAPGDPERALAESAIRKLSGK